MFAEERQKAIVGLINKNGSVRVKDLSAKFNVTEDSIRKDFALLEKKGLIKKTYGGAVKVRINTRDIDVSQRKNKNTELKQRIAYKALSLIKDGDMVFLDISTTSIELAKLLANSDLRVTVVTNMIDVMLEFMNITSIKIVFIGGTFSRGHDGFVGSSTIEQIKNFKFDLSFLGVVGIDVFENSVSTYMIEDGLTKKAILENSKKSYMLLESQKFNIDGTYKYSKIDSFTGIISESTLDKDITDQFKDYNVEIIF